jgi:nucleoside-diphosphate-sugar epimerase
VITGADGFIGRALGPALEAAGWAVRGLGHAGGDVTDPRTVERFAQPADALIHLAFPTRAAFRRDHPVEALFQVAAGTAGALALARACGVRHVVLASSGKVYGNPARLPVDEAQPACPTTFLGELKRLQETLAGLAARESGAFGATCLRLFNVYGPGAPDGFVLPRLLAALAGAGRVTLGELDHRRDWIGLPDAAAAFATVLGSPPAPGEVRAFNVGSGEARSVRDVVEALERVSGRRLEVVQEEGLRRPGEAPEERADCAALRALGWRPTLPMEDGLRELWGGS